MSGDDLFRVLAGAAPARQPQQFPGVYEAKVTRVSLAGPFFTIEGMGVVQFGPARYSQDFARGSFRPPARGSGILVAFIGGDPDRPVALSRLSTRSPLYLPQAQALVCYTLDDCWKAQLPVVNHMLALGGRPTIFPNHNATAVAEPFGVESGNPDCYLIADLVRMSRQGAEIGNHTMHHYDLSARTPLSRADELDDFTDYLVANGIPAPTSFANPYGFRNVYVDRDLATRFRIYRYAGIAEVDRSRAASAFRIGATRILTDTATPSGLGDSRISDVKAMLRRAVGRPVIYVFFNHLGPSYEGTEASVTEFRELLDYTAELGIPMVTLQEAFGTFGLAPNPSFEEDPDSAVGWPFELTTGAGAISIEEVVPYEGGDGHQALSLHTEDAGDTVYKGCRHSVIPGEAYLVSGRYRLFGAAARTTYEADAFTRTVGAGGWGGAWTVQSGTAANFSVDGDEAVVSMPASATPQYATLGLSLADVDVTGSWQISPAPAGANLDFWVIFRWVGVNDFMYAVFEKAASASGGIGAMKVFKVVAGVTTQVGSTITQETAQWGRQTFVNPGAAEATRYRVQVLTETRNSNQPTTTIRLKWWHAADESEPAGWTLVISDSSLPTAAGDVGLGAKTAGSLSNGPLTLKASEVTVTSPDGTTGAGLRFRCYQLGVNNNVLLMSEPNGLEAPRMDREQTDWAWFGMDAPLTMSKDTVALEIRAYLGGLAGVIDADVDHVVTGLARSQPDGPLG